MRVAVAVLGLVAVLAPSFARAQDSSLAARADLRRSLREHLFLDGRLGFRQRSIVYAEDAAEGPDGRSEARFHFDGRYRGAGSGGLGAYVGLGVIGRFGADDQVGDPVRSPYDDFDGLQNIRVFGAWLQYDLRNVDEERTLLVRGGRLSDLDARARLLLFDGARLEVPLGPVTVGAYGGRRAVLDGDFVQDRDDVEAQLVTGVFARGRLGDFSARIGHRFEGIHRLQARVGWTPGDRFGLGLSGEVLFGGDESVATDAALYGFDDPGSGPAVVLRIDGDARSRSGQTAGWLVGEVQIGQDPRIYGRAGPGPRDDEVQDAIQSGGGAGSAARLDRLFFGPGQPNVWVETGVEHWFVPVFGLQAGLYARIPYGDAATRSHQPRVIEGWGGPELAFAGGYRVAVEGRFAVEDTGDADSLFGVRGAGERRSGTLRAYGEVPFTVAESWVFALRPELEGVYWADESLLVETDNQLGFHAGLLAAVRTGTRLRIALRYGAGSLPDLTSAGVEVVHDVEAWVGGAF